jgi:hypothetical protein
MQPPLLTRICLSQAVLGSESTQQTSLWMGRLRDSADRDGERGYPVRTSIGSQRPTESVNSFSGRAAVKCRPDSKTLLSSL